MQPETRIGENAIVNTNASVDHECLVGDHVHIAPGGVIAGGVRIGNGSFVGANATIIDGVSVGSNSTVGAGAVVIDDVPSGCTVVGVPATPVGS